MTVLAFRKWILDAALQDSRYASRIMAAFDTKTPKEALTKLEKVLTDYCKEHNLKVAKV